MRLLVTGAGGFLGRRVLEALADSQWEVHATGRRPSPIAGEAWHAADLLDANDTAALVASVAPTHLIHLAWTTEHGSFWNSPDNHEWRMATVELIRHFIAAGGVRAVLAGSCAEYDWDVPQLATDPCDEVETPLRPATEYGRSKLATFEEAETLSHAAGIELAWARLFFMFGVEEHPDRLIPSIIRAALSGDRLELHHPQRELDFMPTDRVAAALVALTNSTLTGPVNVASGRGVQIEDLAGKIYALVGASVAPPSHSQRGDALRVVAATTRLSTRVGFDPKYDLDDSLAPVISWWRKAVKDTESTISDDQQARLR